ncbi:hypothetical protein [Xanthomonas fragariae]
MTRYNGSKMYAMASDS